MRGRLDPASHKAPGYGAHVRAQLCGFCRGRSETHGRGKRGQEREGREGGREGEPGGGRIVSIRFLDFPLVFKHGISKSQLESGKCTFPDARTHAKYTQNARLDIGAGFPHKIA